LLGRYWQGEIFGWQAEYTPESDKKPEDYRFFFYSGDRDGRSVSVPLAWFPRLMHGTPAERNQWRLIGDGEGIHRSDLDEDISVENLILGKPSGETRSLSRSGWRNEARASNHQNSETLEI
jgi:hypothetical protein